MFSLGITAPGVRFDCSTVEGVRRAAAAGAEGIEVYSVEDVAPETLLSTAATHDIEVFGTLATGAGSNIDSLETPAMTDPEDSDRAVADIETSIETAAKLGCSVLVVTVGPEQDDVDWMTQRDAIVDILRAVAPAAEHADVTIVVEPLNVRVDHPGYFLTTSAEAASIVEAVDSSNVKLLFDIYHQQVTEGDVVRRLREFVDAIGHIHVADNPGRHQPGTGELNYKCILAAVADLDYDGYVSCEFAPLGDPDSVFRDVVELADAAREGAT